MNAPFPTAVETTCPECTGEGITRLGSDAWEVCETCFGVGSVKAGPAYPARCAACSFPLKWAGKGRWYPCTHHPESRVVYYLQESRAGYPAGSPLCRCGEPAVSGKATCGQYTCNTALAKAGGHIPQGQKL